MMAPLQKHKRSGFTIIEVMIVLAIAGLILAIVFLAVPALQRTSRNTQRKNDVSSLLSAVSNYEDNNAGGFPSGSPGTAVAFSTAFPNDSPNLGYYTIPGNVTWKYQTAKAAPADPADLDKVMVANYAKCSGNAATTTGATARSVVAVYDVEGSGGTLVPQCAES